MVKAVRENKDSVTEADLEAEIDARAPRGSRSEVRASDQDESWTPAELLPEPVPQEGIVFRWLRLKTHGVVDETNISQRFREGWVLVKAEEQPELAAACSIGVERSGGNIEVGDLVLAKMDSRRAIARRDHYVERSQLEMEAVDNNLMKLNDKRAPLFHQRSERR